VGVSLGRLCMIASVKVVNELEEAIGAFLRGRKFRIVGKR
jgi:hypothetical protein